MFSRKPKQKRLTTAKATLNTTINVTELLSPSEEENEDEVDEWLPENAEKGPRASKKPKLTGVRPTWVLQNGDGIYDVGNAK